ncbi:LacI family DNA-binding transcriptional regulator [Leifsonia xyli]|uniref:LacI family DNA-binding transcriptional regulator n=1 Tax=Leifsonia xyli TaxID=1575 RepID=UPI003D678529
MPAPTRPTLEAIAREASVSLSTVSKVLNGRPGVSAATRRRVEDLLHDSGYARRGWMPSAARRWSWSSRTWRASGPSR